MLNRRIIPKLLLKEIPFGSSTRKVLVTTVQFSKSIPVGDPVSQARVYESQLADELVFLDLDLSVESDDRVLKILRGVAEQVFLPLTAGGGVRTVEGARRLLQNGADKVSLNSAALEDPSLISRLADTFGSQAVVLSVDYRVHADGRRRVYRRNGSVDSGKDPLDWVLEAQRLGAGEILLTSIEHDGMRQGLDLAFADEVAKSTSIPVIVSGGCGRAEHFVEGFTQGSADAIAAGTFFCFKDENPMQARSRIKNAGLPIRLET